MALLLLTPLDVGFAAYTCIVVDEVAAAMEENGRNRGELFQRETAVA